MHMKTAGFVFAAILSAIIMFGTVMAVANAGMSQVAPIVSRSVVVISSRRPDAHREWN